MRVGHAWVMVVCGMVLGGQAGVAEKEYTLVTSRAAKVGDVYDFHETFSRTSTTSIIEAGAAPASASQALLADLSGRIEVLEVDAGGNERNSALTVTNFGMGPTHTPVATPGMVIEIKRTDKGVNFSVRGGPALDDEAEKALQLMFHRIEPDVPGADAALVGKNTRKVGETWKVDLAGLSKLGLGKESRIDLSKIAATMTLKGVEKVQGMEALRLVLDSTIADFNPGELPAGYTVEQSELKMKLSWLLPVDKMVRVLGKESTGDMKAVLTNGATHAKIELKTQVVEKRTTTPVKK